MSINTKSTIPTGNPVKDKLIITGTMLWGQKGNGSYPSFQELSEHGITVKKIRYYFDTLSNYHACISHQVVMSNIQPKIAKIDKKDNVASDVQDDTKILLITEAIDFVQKNNRLPGYTDFSDQKTAKNGIRYHFGNLGKFQEYVKENYSDEIEDYLFDEDIITSPANAQALRNAISGSGSKKFVITSATNDRPVDAFFLKAIKNYCALNDAKLLIIPSADSSIVKSWSFDPIIKNELFVSSNISLNENLYISPILFSSKQIRPVGGLGRLTQSMGSLIIGSPKQELEFIATSSARNSIPRALMSTGSITAADYSDDDLFTRKSSYIAEIDHVIGAIIVEIIDDKEFHFRQIQSDPQGGFTDLGEYYCHNTTDANLISERELHLICGDYHVGWTDPDVEAVTEQMLKDLPITDVYLHDFFDGRSISHHDMNLPMKSARKAFNGYHILEDEIDEGVEKINWFLDRIPGKLVMICGNHDEFLARYLERCGYVEDKVNHRFALDLAIAYFDGLNPLKVAYENTSKIKDPSRIIWLDRDEPYIVAGVELGDHGDKGFNGSKGSLLSAERAHKDAVIGHTHSGAIQRGVYRVGTSTVLKMDYNKGSSNWTQTHCLLDVTSGSRQLTNIINNKYRG